MSTFTGTLTIISNQSSLDGDLLLKSGIPDTAQAMFAATQFLVKIRKLQPGQLIDVMGQKVPNISAILMDDARAASVQPLGVAVLNPTFDAASAESDLIRAFAELGSSTAESKKTEKTGAKEKVVKTEGKKTTKSARKDRSNKKNE
jgi:hypothetical protein